MAAWPRPSPATLWSCCRRWPRCCLRHCPPPPLVRHSPVPQCFNLTAYLARSCRHACGASHSKAMFRAVLGVHVCERWLPILFLTIPPIFDCAGGLVSAFLAPGPVLLGIGAGLMAWGGVSSLAGAVWSGSQGPICQLDVTTWEALCRAGAGKLRHLPHIALSGFCIRRQRGMDRTASSCVLHSHTTADR